MDNIFKEFGKFIDNIPKDKKLHFLVGFAITVLLSFFVSYSVALIIALIIGAVKELYDKITGKGKPDILDFLSVAAGAFVADTILLVIRQIFFGIFG